VSQHEAGDADSPGAVQEGREAFPKGMREGAGERPPAPDIDISKPHVARMYDYFLGGKNNYAADREAAEQFLKVMPQVRAGAKANRKFLVDSVRWLVQEAGVRQFIDIGSGLPTQQNVHEAAQALDKNAKVVYVDNDPLVRVHAEVLLATTPNTIVLEADLRDPKALLDRPELREHIDFSQPVALLLVAVMHFILDTEEAYRIADTLFEALPPGSYVVMSHGLLDENLAEAQQEGRAIYNRSNSGFTVRTREEIARFFEGLTPVGPGLTHIADWSIDGTRAQEDDVVSIDDLPALRDVPVLCCVARKDR